MMGPLVQMVVLVTMTHGFRVLARWVGPSRSGLLTGLPSTTALVLVGCGLERGLDEASMAAEACLVSLVASAALPLAYAMGSAAGWRFSTSALAAVCGYVAVAAGLWGLPDAGAAGSVAVSAAGVATACFLAKRIRLKETCENSPRRPLPAAGLFAYRTAVPAGYFLLIRLLRVVGGASLARRFITFPGGSLAVLVTTHLEAGPETACRMATAMPSGGLGMLAFLTAFRYACPRFGLGWATVSGFAAALSALALVVTLSGDDGRDVAERTSAHFDRRRAHRPHSAGFSPRFRSGSESRPIVGRCRFRQGRGFSPWVETLAG